MINPMDAYVIIGKRNSRKSSICRALTGAAQRCARDIRNNLGTDFKIYVRISSLQESKVTAADFLGEVSSKKTDAVLFCLWFDANKANPKLYPKAYYYLDEFSKAGWNIKKIAVLDEPSTLTCLAPRLLSLASPFPCSTTTPINVTSAEVRKHFEWK